MVKINGINRLNIEVLWHIGLKKTFLCDVFNRRLLSAFQWYFLVLECNLVIRMILKWLKINFNFKIIFLEHLLGKFYQFFLGKIRQFYEDFGLFYLFYQFQIMFKLKCGSESDSTDEINKLPIFCVSYNKIQ